MTTLRSSLAAALAGLSLVACGPPPPTSSPCAELLPGDLVVTELMKNPNGTDSGQEWFELHNPGDAELSLTGIDLVVSRSDGSVEKRHRLAAGLVIPAGGYFAVGDAVAPEGGSLPEWLDYSYGDKLGGLPNTTGRIALKCGQAVIDEVIYPDVGASGVAMQLSGALVPDGVNNDDAANWCAATVAYDGVQLGTPGGPNGSCGGVVGGQCTDPETGTLRDLVLPAAGEVVITEIMADPSVVGDADGEWFEVHAPTRAVDLNGLLVGTADAAGKALTAETCLALKAGGFALLAHKQPAAENGGYEGVLATFSQSLPNGGGTIVLRAGETVIDAATYGAAKPGTSLQLPPDRLTAGGNDEVDAYCDSTNVLSNGEKGTPGVANAACGPVDPGGAKCVDATSGEERALIVPAVGELVITEVMADPAAVSDAQGEWLEVHAPGRTVDLNGLTLGNATTGALLTGAGSTCLTVTAGGYALLARNADPATNGGHAQVLATFTQNLTNAGMTVAIRAGDVVIDQATYGSTSAGVALQLPPDLLDAAENDDAGAFCKATTAIGNGDFGTPGAPNTTCTTTPGEDTCVDPVSGEPRAKIAPQAGDLIINEIMANPAGTESDREWFEIFVTRDVDLNGVVLGSSSGTTPLASTACLAAYAAEHLIFARKDSEALNGGLPEVFATFGFTLANTNGTVRVSYGGELLDEAGWTSSTDGVSAQLKPDFQNTTDNDLPANHCQSTALAEYGPGGRGTPGAANVCP